jgi:hypothetical protein
MAGSSGRTPPSTPASSSPPLLGIEEDQVKEDLVWKIQPSHPATLIANSTSQQSSALFMSQISSIHVDFTVNEEKIVALLAAA